MATASDFTAADVLAWARTKPAELAYNYIDAGNCALCQFLRETDRAETPRVIDTNWRDGMHSKERFAYPKEIDLAALWGETFGGFARLLSKAVTASAPASVWTTADAYLAEFEQVR